MKIKFILFALSLCVAKVPFAYALSWSFNQDKNVDQILIGSDGANENIQTIRTDTNKIFIQGNNFSKNLQAIKGNVIADVIPGEYGLTIVLNDNAFGFVQHPDDKGNIVIGIYKDPLGARWKPTERSINLSREIRQKENNAQAKLEGTNRQQERTATNTRQNADMPRTAALSQQAGEQVSRTGNSNLTGETAQPNRQTAANPNQAGGTPQRLQTAQTNTALPTQDNTRAQNAVPSGQGQQPVSPAQNQAPVISGNTSAGTTQTQQPPVSQQTQQAQQQAASGQRQNSLVSNQIISSTVSGQTINPVPSQPIQTPVLNNSQQEVVLSGATHSNVINSPVVEQTHSNIPNSVVTEQANPNRVNSTVVAQTNANNVNSNKTNSPATEQNGQQTKRSTEENLQNSQRSQTETSPSLLDYISSQKDQLVLVAEAAEGNTSQMIEQAETIKPEELTPPQQNQTANTGNPIPSVTLKLNSGSPSQTHTITKDEIKSQELENEVTQKDNAEQLSTPHLIEKEEETLPLVIEDKKHDTIIPQTEEELSQQSEAPVMQPQEISPEEPAQIPGEIIYVDEEGNPVPAPLDIPATIQNMRKAYNLGVYETVFEEAEKLKSLNLPKNLLEEIFYNRAKAFFVMNNGNLKNVGESFISYAQEALNVNDESTRKPELLANLVATYLELDRPAEARAYTDILYKTYPYSVDTPNAILLLSDYLLQHHEYTLATQYLQILIDKYPDNTYAKNAAMLQIKTLHKLGNLDRTLAMINFIDRRWPKVYLEFPDYLLIKAHVLEEQKQIPDAIAAYWQIYNLNPEDEGSGDILFKIANLYYDLHQNDSAKKVLEQLYQQFPKHKSAPRALLYMGENGRFDDRTKIDDIIAIFNEHNPEYPATYYNKIISEYPDSEEALIATLRLATLKYLEQDYFDAAKLAQSVFDNNIDKFESESAAELLHRAFDPLFRLSLSEQNYERTLMLWESFPAVHRYYEPITSEMRLAIAKAYINRDNTAEAEKLLTYFLDKVPTNEIEYQEGIYAYDIFLAHALNKQEWSRVLETNKKIDSWALPEEKENNKKYTTAIAAENLGLEARALPLWQELAANESIPLYQRAYAQYFLARDAERKQNIRAAYQANLDALAMFEDLRNVQSPYASPERERESIAAIMDITEIAGRYTEALEWLNRYRNYISENSTDYAGLQLREARLHRKMGDTLRWKSILEDVRRREPESIYGKMASSELNTYEMARDLTRFTGNN